MNITDEHKRLLKAVKKDLYPWREYTIAVDGRDHSGKSCTARFLAWQLEMPALETDMFLIRDPKPARYDYEELRKLLMTRHSMNRPVIVEGIKILETLECVEVKPNFVIFMKNGGFEGSEQLKPEIAAYLRKYCPECRANFVFDRLGSGDTIPSS
jgi:hypothetical protein